MASKKTNAKKTSKWAKNASDYAKKQQAKGKGKGNTEDKFVGGKGSPSKRIRDLGQPEPKGYMRTGGRYFAKIANMRPIKSQTTWQQRGLFYSNRDKYLGPDEKGGWVGSAAHQGMYDGETGEMNFRKTAGARKNIDADGGTYSPEYYQHFDKGGKPKKPGGAKYKKSRYIMAIGQDGHMR